MNKKKLAIGLVKNILLRSWLTISFFLSISVFIFAVFDNSYDFSFFLGILVSLFLIPMVIVKEIFRYYMSEIYSHYAFIWGTVIFIALLFLLFVLGEKILSEELLSRLGGDVAEILGTGFLGLIFLSPFSYLFQKYLAPKRWIQITFSVLGVTLLGIFFFYNGQMLFNVFFKN